MFIVPPELNQWTCLFRSTVTQGDRNIGRKTKLIIMVHIRKTNLDNNQAEMGREGGVWMHK